MRLLSLLVLALTVSGCGLGSSLVRDVVSAAPAFCSETDGETDHADVEKAARDVMALIPEGSDKDKAQALLNAAEISTEMLCNAVKGIEAQYVK